MKRLIVAAMCCVVLVGCNKKEKPRERKSQDIEIGMQIIAKRLVLGVLKNPDSAQFRNLTGPCGEVNSKNAFGGMVGYQRFIAAREDLVILENESAFSPDSFQSLWDKACKYRPK